jgi:hypothetical protein
MIDPGGGSEVELFLRDGVDLTFVQGLEMAEVDVLGVYDVYTSGDAATFELKVPELSADILAVVFRDGLSGTGYRGFGKTAGNSKRANAKQIRFRPWQTRDVATEQVIFWLCVTDGDTAFAMKKTDPWTFSVPMRALPDTTKADGELIAQIYAVAR